MSSSDRHHQCLSGAELEVISIVTEVSLNRLQVRMCHQCCVSFVDVILLTTLFIFSCLSPDHLVCCRSSKARISAPLPFALLQLLPAASRDLPGQHQLNARVSVRSD